MPRLGLFLIVDFVACFIGWPATALDVLPIPSKLQIIEQAIRDGEIAQLNIYFMPYEKLTRIQVTPDLLESWADRKITVAFPAAAFGTLERAIAKTKAHPVEMSADLRWGLVMYDTAGKSVHSIYLDGRYVTGNGRSGYIDGTTVSLNGVLIRWFETNFLN